MTFFITGTDTEIGKTVASAWTMLHLKAKYWKPVQSGMEDETDAEAIVSITECESDAVFPSTYELQEPLSPHEAAMRDGVTIELSAFNLPETDTPLIVEGAGGLMVPLNEKHFMIDLIAHLDLPAILVCRSGLGTINHTLLSLEALRNRNLSVAGVIIVGPSEPHNRKAIEYYGKVPVLVEIPHLISVNRDALLSIKPEPAFLKLQEVN